MAIKYLFFILSFCSFFLSASQERSFKDNRHKITRIAIRKFKHVMQEKGYHASGIGEGVDHSNGKQNYLEMVFDVDVLPDIEFARQIEAMTIGEFLNCINSVEKIDQYLSPYPFTTDNISISFLSRNPMEGLSSVWSYKNEIIYSKKNPEKPMSLSIDIHSETYEEALCILEKNAHRGVRQ